MAEIRMTDDVLSGTPVKDAYDLKRTRIYGLAETYNKWLVREWTTRTEPGREDEHDKAKTQLMAARTRMERASRGK